MKTVLVVDDSAYMRALVKMALSENGYEVVGEAANGKEALEQAIKLNPDIITLDNILPDMFGIDILKKLKGDGHGAKIIMVSAVGQDRVIEKVKKMGACGYIVKPFEPDYLISEVNRVSAMVLAA